LRGELFYVILSGDHRLKRYKSGSRRDPVGREGTMGRGRATEYAVKSYYVYMMSSRHRSALYTGFTNSLERRIAQHKSRLIQGFTSRYYSDKLVYFEETTDVWAAIAREKEIKGWTRAKKVALVESVNPGWCDLSECRFDPELPLRQMDSSPAAGDAFCPPCPAAGFLRGWA
jgi:putative endonuclease